MRRGRKKFGRDPSGEPGGGYRRAMIRKLLFVGQGHAAIEPFVREGYEIVVV